MGYAAGKVALFVPGRAFIDVPKLPFFVLKVFLFDVGDLTVCSWFVNATVSGQSVRGTLSGVGNGATYCAKLSEREKALLQ